MSGSTFLDVLVAVLTRAGEYNRNDQVAPAAVLWPDQERQWETLLPLLRPRLPLLTLGEYNPDTRTGPAYYLRCLIAGTLTDRLPAGVIPILYLSGVSRQDLRAVEECPKFLQPLAELQYRGVLWTHKNGRDWTIAGFLQNKEGGLGIPIGSDNATKEALPRALLALAHESIAGLRAAAPLRAPFFNSLLAPDDVRRLLLWMSDPESCRQETTSVEWLAFSSLCEQKYGLNPAETSPVVAAEHLIEQRGPWVAVWQRYAEAPERYPGIETLLRQLPPAQLRLFQDARSPYHPQDNETAESELRTAMTALDNRLPKEVRRTVRELEETHGERRTWVWCQLGQAPLAQALGSLAQLAEITEKPLGGLSVITIAEQYADWGWQVDRAVLDALGAVSAAADVAAVKAALLPLYRSWLTATATALQRAFATRPDEYEVPAPVTIDNGTCILFCDALRYDVGQRLAEKLQDQALHCTINWQFAALPPVTATAKPAVSPVAHQLVGSDVPLTPVVRESGRPLRIDILRGLLTDSGYQVLMADELGNPAGRAWSESGAIDRYGHDHGWKLAHHVRHEVTALVDRIQALLDHGWQEVHVVTDHGWLLLPDGLPKAQLPEHLTHTRKGRCAVLKPGARTDQQVVPWHWHTDVSIAVAPDIACYEAGKEYEHGGISPQECVVPVLRVRRQE